MTTKFEFHFRNTVGSWNETGTSVYVLGTDLWGSSGTLRNGLTFGWSSTSTSADVSGPNNAKLSGRNANTGNSTTFRWNLPEGPGKYRIWLGLGIGTTITTGYEIRDSDNSTVLASLASTTVTNGQVADATGIVYTYANWLSSNSSAGGGNYIEVTASGSSLYIKRHPTNSLYISYLAFELQEEPLDGSVVTTDTGTGTLGSIYSKEPAGKKIGKVSSPKGTQNFSIIGAGSTYFTVQTIDGLPWIVTTSTRLPVNYSSGITVRQTAGAQTKDTTFTPTIIDTGNRPVDNTNLGDMDGITWMERKKILDVESEEWAGYTNQSFVGDYTASSTASFTSIFNSIIPNGTGWYRIRCQDGGDWTGQAGLNYKDFGNGGLLIEPDSGHDPLLNFWATNMAVRKMHIRGLRICPPTKDINNGRMFEHSSVNATPYCIWKFSENRIGHLQKFGASMSDFGTWGYFVYMMFCEQVIFRDNKVDGIAHFAVVSGGRNMISENNDFTRVVGDFHAFSTAYRHSTPRNVFANNETYVRIRNNTVRFNPDVYTGLTGSATPHGDFIQIRRTDGYPFTARPNSNNNAVWAVNNKAFVLSSGNLYTVVGVTTGVADANNPPTGTGTGIVSGGVTFDYSGNYPQLATRMNVLLEGNVCLADGISVNADGNASPNIQFVINSNAGFGNQHVFVAVNNISASGNSRGIQGSTDGIVYAHRNTFVAGSQMPVVDGITIGLNQAYIQGQHVHARLNIIGKDTSGGGAYIVSLDNTPMSENNAIADFAKTAIDGQKPSDVMKGTFILNAGGDYEFPSIQDDGQNTPANFISEMSKQLHSKTGAVGARLKEYHSIIVSDSSGKSKIVDLIILP